MQPVFISAVAINHFTDISYRVKALFLTKRKRIRMKLKFVFAGIALCLFGLMACEKETSFETGSTPTGDTTGNGGNGGGTNVTGDMRAKIDGVQWVADKATGAARMNGLISIAGLSIDKKTIVMTLQDSGVHQYTLYYDGPLNVGAFQDSSLQDISAFATNQGSSASESGGTVNITSIDEVNKKISGTFSFKTKRMVDETYRNITEGSFTNLSYSTSLPPANSTDTFKVKIDGAAFTPAAISGISVMGNIMLSGTDATGVKGVSLTFPSTITPGAYTLDFLGLTYIGQYNIDMNTFLVAQSGTLTILEHNTATKRIRGTFSFSASELTGTKTAELTEGSFSVTYQ
jgi:hypothetical protein